ncbi:glycerate kinase, partial [Salmonella enterica subsp. enterica serovar Anatum]|nr:glycerate kinase [Salmonella enterica subsp. enterica serovar Anatum]
FKSSPIAAICVLSVPPLLVAQGMTGSLANAMPEIKVAVSAAVELDRNLAHYADIIKKSLNVDVKAAPGAGAAGGMGAALMAFL